MKYTRYIAPVTLAIALTFTMCDYITNPNEVTGPVTQGHDTTKRVALIEEWTGHTCIACPAAAEDLHMLDSLYGESFISISIHDDFFAEPCPPHPMPNCGVGHPGAFAEDFRCPTGQDYSATFPVGPSSPPQGMVNRLDYPGNEVKTRGVWPGLVDSIQNEDACASMHIDHVYNSSSRELGVTVWGTWLQAYTGNINVCVMLTESGMVGWQTDGTVCDSNFVFEHVLRECINTPGSITGNSISTGTTLVGTTYSYALPSAYTVPVAYDATHCHLVAFIYDTTTKEILQAWEVEL
jgi:hypothetical protein